MKHITVFPYLGVRGEKFLWNDVSIWNFMDLKNEKIQDSSIRDALTKVVKMHQFPEWVNVITIGSLDFRKFEKDRYDFEKLYKTQLLLMISIFAKGNVVPDERHWSTTDHFRVITLNVNPINTTFVYSLGPLLNRITKESAISDGVFQLPEYVAPRSSLNTEVDWDLFNALVRLEKKKGKRFMVGYYDAFEKVAMSWINVDLMSSTARWMFMHSAFENLFGKGRKNVKNKIDSLFPDRRKYKATQLNEGVPKPDGFRTSHAIWFEHFSRLRNLVTHIGSANKQVQNYHGQSHKYIATLMFIVCLKKHINNLLGTHLSGDVFRRRVNNDLWFIYED